MNAKRIELYHLSMPLKSPFVTSFGTVSDRHTVVGRFEFDDALVWAESPTLEAPLYTEEHTYSVLDTFKRFIGPAMLGTTWNAPHELYDSITWLQGNAMTKHLADTALYHAFSERDGVSLASYLGGTKDSVQAGLSIGIQPSLDELVEKASWGIEQGFKRIKVKVKPGYDVLPVSTLRDQLNSAPLSVDANASYSADRIPALLELDRYDLTMIEQPFTGTDLARHALLQSQMRTPVCLDESITCEDRMEEAVLSRAGRIVNLKPGRVGGFTASLRIAEIATLAGFDVWVGGMAETGIGKSDLIALSAHPNITMPADIGPSSWYFERDIIDPTYHISDGTIDVSDRPGVGYQVMPELVKHFTVDTIKMEVE